MRRYRESMQNTTLPKLSSKELIQLDLQVETMLQENGINVDELHSYQEDSSGVRHVQFYLDGDWKHEHLKTKMLMEKQGWSLYNKSYTDDILDSDYYEARYDFIYKKDLEAVELYESESVCALRSSTEICKAHKAGLNFSKTVVTTDIADVTDNVLKSAYFDAGFNNEKYFKDFVDGFDQGISDFLEDEDASGESYDDYIEAEMDDDQ